MSEIFTGTGTLLAGGSEHSCQYQLEVRTSGGLKEGSGFVVSTPEALWTGFNEERSMVTMSDGRKFPITIIGYSLGNGDAAFRMTGSMTA